MPTRAMTVRQITLVGFRDNVVLKLKMEEALKNNDQPIPKSITQMFCILLQVIRVFFLFHKFYIRTVLMIICFLLLGLNTVMIRSTYVRFIKNKGFLFSCCFYNLNCASFLGFQRVFIFLFMSRNWTLFSCQKFYFQTITFTKFRFLTYLSYICLSRHHVITKIGPITISLND